MSDEKQIERYGLVDYVDPILKQVCVPFDFATTTDDPKHLALSMLGTMSHHGGVGLAANQVGFNHRLFVIGINDGKNKFALAVFNPQIIESSDEVEEQEGCLSTPGLFLPIKRPSRIKVKFQGLDGKEISDEFTGFVARIFLHEYDHLEGKMFTDLVSRAKLERAREKVTVNLRRMKRMREQHELKIKEQAKAEVEAQKKGVDNRVLKLDTNALKATLNVG